MPSSLWITIVAHFTLDQTTITSNHELAGGGVCFLFLIIFNNQGSMAISFSFLQFYSLNSQHLNHIWSSNCSREFVCSYKPQKVQQHWQKNTPFCINRWCNKEKSSYIHECSWDLWGSSSWGLSHHLIFFFGCFLFCKTVFL